MPCALPCPARVPPPLPFSLTGAALVQADFHVRERSPGPGQDNEAGLSLSDRHGLAQGQTLSGSPALADWGAAPLSCWTRCTDVMGDGCRWWSSWARASSSSPFRTNSSASSLTTTRAACASSTPWGRWWAKLRPVRLFSHRRPTCTITVLTCGWGAVRRSLFEARRNRIGLYCERIAFLDGYTGETFKVRESGDSMRVAWPVLARSICAWLSCTCSFPRRVACWRAGRRVAVLITHPHPRFAAHRRA